MNFSESDEKVVTIVNLYMSNKFTEVVQMSKTLFPISMPHVVQGLLGSSELLCLDYQSAYCTFADYLQTKPYQQYIFLISEIAQLCYSSQKYSSNISFEELRDLTQQINNQKSLVKIIVVTFNNRLTC